jgi:hypothetical protein
MAGKTRTLGRKQMDIELDTDSSSWNWDQVLQNDPIFTTQNRNTKMQEIERESNNRIQELREGRFPLVTNLRQAERERPVDFALPIRRRGTQGSKPPRSLPILLTNPQLGCSSKPTQLGLSREAEAGGDKTGQQFSW